MQLSGDSEYLAIDSAFIAPRFIWQRRLLRRQTHPGAHGAAATPPLMNLQLFGHRPFAFGAIVAFIYGTALFGSTYLLPVYMQMGLGLAPAYVGTILLPAGIVLAVAIAMVGRLADRHPAHRLVSLGLALLAASFALMPTLGPASAMGWLVAYAILGRIGLGFILPSLNLGAMRGIAHELIPQGSSVVNFMRMLGGAVGVSLCGILLEWRLAAHGQTLAPALDPASAARLAAFDEVFVVLATLCLLALAAAWQMRSPATPASEITPQR